MPCKRKPSDENVTAMVFSAAEFRFDAADGMATFALGREGIDLRVAFV